MNGLELRVPPVAAAVLAAAAMCALAAVWPGVTAAWPLALRIVAGFILSLAGLAVCLAGVVAFRRARTTVNPLTPERTTALVDRGVYAWTRNPMYVGMTLILAGLALGLANAAAAIVPAGFAFFIDRFQIVPEERALSAQFGSAFDTYRARVRRWL